MNSGDPGEPGSEGSFQTGAIAARPGGEGDSAGRRSISSARIAAKDLSRPSQHFPPLPNPSVSVLMVAMKTLLSSRRRFLQGSAAAAAGPFVLPFGITRDYRGEWEV